MTTLANSFNFQPDAFQVDAFFDANVTNIKAFNGLDTSLVKSVDALAIASVKGWDGLVKGA